MFLLIMVVVVLVVLFLFVRFLARLGRNSAPIKTQTPPFQTIEASQVDSTSPLSALPRGNQANSKSCGKCHGTGRQNCIWCGGMGAKMTTKTIMETKMVPTTEFHTDYRGPRSVRTVMKSVTAPRTTTE